jgi:hypothetical protein
MRLRVGSDEFMLYFCSAEDDRLGGEVLIEMSPIAYADYKRVQAEHESWQKRLHQLWQQQQRMSG